MINEQQIAINYLKSLKPGFLPQDFFYEITRLSVSSILEIVPLRKQFDDIEILLLKRPSDDPYWADQLHTPGTFIRATDTPITLQSAVDRIFKDELEMKTMTVHFVSHVFHKVKRGMELSLIYYVDLSNQKIADVGEWYKVEELPVSLVDTQREFITIAIETFKKDVL